MTQRRILVTSGIYPPDVGGPATYVQRLVRSLESDDREIRAVVLADDPTVAPNGVSAIARGEPIALRTLRTIARVRSECRRDDTVYANGLFLESAIAAGLRRSRLVMKVVGDYAWEVAHNRSRTDLNLEQFQSVPSPTADVALIRSMQRWWVRRADALIVNSRFLASIVRGWGASAERIKVIPNAVVIPREARPRQRTERPGVLRALTGGRLLHWKGFGLLLRVALMQPRLELTIVGDGPLRPTLAHDIRRLGLSQRVTLLPPQHPDDVARLYDQFDVFLLASTSETFSYMTAEAMASGLPVIVARSGALPEVVDQDAGLLCSPGSPDEWVGTLEGLATDRDLYTEMARRGHETARARYSWDEVYPATLDVLNGVG